MNLLSAERAGVLVFEERPKVQLPRATNSCKELTYLRYELHAAVVKESWACTGKHV